MDNYEDKWIVKNVSGERALNVYVIISSEKLKIVLIQSRYEELILLGGLHREIV